MLECHGSERAPYLHPPSPLSPPRCWPRRRGDDDGRATPSAGGQGSNRGRVASPGRTRGARDGGTVALADARAWVAARVGGGWHWNAQHCGAGIVVKLLVPQA